MARRQVAYVERPYNWQRARRPDRTPGPLRWVLAGIVLFLVVGLGGVGFVYYKIHSPQGSGSAAVDFVIRSGDTDSSVANRLQADGLIGNTTLFRLDARLRGLGGKLRIGYYRLRRDMSIDDMIGVLVAGHSVTIKITIPEGWRAGQIAAELQRHHISGAQFLQTVEHPKFGIGFLAGRPRGSSLQGFLFPDTYSVLPNETGADFARRMVEEFAQHFTPGMRRLARQHGHSVYQIVTLASIVEREARMPAERPTIASVYYNRLAQAPRLMDADPTVQYALAKDSAGYADPADPRWWPQIRSQHQYSTAPLPYNTYRRAGLPPGPICNPGLASLWAALQPAHTSYLYFVAKGNSGYHAFARTLAEQEANIRKYSK